MVFPRINNPKTTTINTYGGDTLNKLQEWFAGINIAATDVTNKPSINTDTRFYSGRLRLFDFDFSNELRFVTPDLTTDAAISFPQLLSSSENNELLFALVTQTIKNKNINAVDNAITNLSNTNIASDAAIAWTKINKTGSALGDIDNINLTGLADDYSIKWDVASGEWVVYSLTGLAGEVNTMSNLAGTAGSVGIFKQKTGVNFELKKINAGSTSVTITDDTANNEVDINVVDATTSLKGKVQLAANNSTTALTVVQANDDRLLNARNPLAHAASHKADGDDLIKINEFAAPTANITTTNATIAANGTAPMLPNNANLFWNGVGGWTEPVGTASGVSGTGSIIRGTATKTGNGSTTVFTIAHGMSVTPTAFFVNPTSVDALGGFILSVDSTNITITYNIAPPTGTSNLTYSWVVFDSGTGSTLGEANTYSSAGTGVAITKTKVGADLPFRSLFAGSTKIAITENPNDISFDVNQGNLAIGWAQLTGVPSTFTATNHAASHLSNGTDAIAAATESARGIVELATSAETTAGLAVQASDTRLSNPRTPNTHAASHSSGQADQLTLSNLAGSVTDAQLSANTLTTTNSKTVASKTISLTTNTVTSSTAAMGEIPVHTATKYEPLAKGPNGSFLGVSGDVVGYFVPPTGSGGLLPDGSAIPSTGRWGALFGGSLTGRGIMDFTVTSNSTTYEIISPTESATVINTAAADDAIARIRTSNIFSRQSNPVFRAKWNLKSTSGITVLIGFSSQATLPVGSAHDDPLDGQSGIMISCSHDVESVYQISRNDGGATQTKVATTKASNNTTAHSCEINLNTTNATVILDGTTYGPYTTEIPALTTALYIFVQIEAIGGTARGISLHREQVTCL